jgi:hypothetical protein
MKTILLSATLLAAAVCSLIAVSHADVSAVGTPTENYTLPDPANDPMHDEIKPQVNFSLQGPSVQTRTSPPGFITDFVGPIPQTRLTVVGDGKWYVDVDINMPGWLYVYEYYPPNNNPSGHWLAYKWQIKQSGIWRLGPFSAGEKEPGGQHVYRFWFYSGGQWAAADPVYSLIYWAYLKDFPELKIDSFTASPLEARAGDKVTLSWAVQGAQSLEISMVGPVQGASGSTTVTVDRTTDFNLLATGLDGRQVQSGSVTVTVTAAAGVPPTTTPPTAPVVPTPPKTPSFAEELGRFFSNPLGVIASVAITAILIALVFLVIRFYLRRGMAEEVAEKEVPFLPESKEEAPPALNEPLQARAKLLLPGCMEIALTGVSRTMGRADMARSLPLDGLALISHSHFLLTYSDGHYFIEDTESTNGTLLNSIDVKGKGQFALQDGDMIEPAGVVQIKFFFTEV